LKAGEKQEEEKMKVVAFNGSARKDGNTAILLNLVLDELRMEQVETERIQPAGEKISGRIARYHCLKHKTASVW
jgi:multimeric flavodoxin WrbA